MSIDITDMISTRTAAKMLGMHMSTLKAWRAKPHSQQPIVWYCIGRNHVRYSRREIADYLARSRFRAADTSGAARAAADKARKREVEHGTDGGDGAAAHERA
jgi:hypothetical protein